MATKYGDNNSGIQARNINGSTITIHSQRPETPPRPSIVIPFPHDEGFVPRGKILDEVHQRCAIPGSRAALVGLGGVGKSQLAIEYAYRTHKQSPETWVFWVHASNAARFEQSFHEIANRVGISRRQDPKTNIFKLVYDWLHNSNKQWLLVLDNVDDDRFLDSPSTDAETTPKLLRDYIPQSEHGSILVTTRSKKAAENLVERRNILGVDPMDEAEGLALFTKKLGVQEDSGDVTELAAALENMPLAIVQAASLIWQRRPRYSVKQYLNEFKKNQRKRMRLLNRDEGQVPEFRRDREAKNAIFYTWQISFEHIRETRPSAADLLSLMSFFDRQGIPAALLQCRIMREVAQPNKTEKRDGDTDSDGEDDFEEDVVALRDFYLISVGTDGTTFEMHALLQLATRNWLECNSRLERWKQQFIHNLDAVFPTGEYKNWLVCQELFPHAKSAAEELPESESSLVKWAALLYRAAWYAWSNGKADEAEKLAVKSMEARQTTLGQEHKDTLNSMEILGLAYSSGGQWHKAANIRHKVIETSKRVLGEEHPFTLTSINNLVVTYIDQGRWKEAEELGVQVVEIRKRVQGEEHPDTLTSINNLALTYMDQGRWKEAEELGVQVVEISKRVQGEEHPDTLTSIDNLALTYQHQGRWKEAEELGVQVAEIRKRVQGEEHPDTLTSIKNLAYILKSQGLYSEAVPLMEVVFQLRKKVFGPQHPKCQSSFRTLERWRRRNT